MKISYVDAVASIAESVGADVLKFPPALAPIFASDRNSLTPKSVMAALLPKDIGFSHCRRGNLDVILACLMK